MLINRIMKNGKKTLASKIVYQMLEKIGKKTEKDPIKVLEQAIFNVKPVVEVKAQRIGGGTYQVPLKVSGSRGRVLAINWILSASKKRSEKSIVSNLSNEIIDASNQIGGAMKRRTEVFRAAEANKAFAKFRI